MTKILITGCKGQVGMSLVKSLKSLNEPTYIIKTDRENFDITNWKVVKKFLCDSKPDFVINAAAYTAVDKAEIEQDMAYQVNVIGPKNLANACEIINCSLIHISTDYVYSGNSSSPYVENDLVSPINFYGKSKFLGEEYVRNICERHIIIRTAWVFSESDKNFVNSILDQAKTKGHLKIVSDQVGGPTSARGISNTITKIIKKTINKTSKSEIWGTYNYSGYPFVTWHQFACEIIKLALKEGFLDSNITIDPISSEELSMLAKRPANSRLDCAKISNVFGIKPDDWKSQLLSVINNF